MMQRCGGCGVSVAIPVGCERLDCDSCQGATSSRRGRRLFDTIGGAAAVIGWTFTAPPELCAVWGWQGAERMRKAAFDVLATVYARLALTDGLRNNSSPRRLVKHQTLHIGGGAAIHPEGDKRPGQWRPHVHLQIPALAIADGRLIRELPVNLPKHWLAEVRKRWGAWLAEEAELLNVEPRDVDTANVHVLFRRGAGPIGHRCRYDWRTFPAWAAGPDSYSKESALRPRRLGLLSPRADKLVELEPLLRWREALLPDQEEAKPARCPAPVYGPAGEVVGSCGCELEGRPEYVGGPRHHHEAAARASGLPIWWWVAQVGDEDIGSGGGKKVEHGWATSRH